MFGLKGLQIRRSNQAFKRAVIRGFETGVDPRTKEPFENALQQSTLYEQALGCEGRPGFSPKDMDEVRSVYVRTSGIEG